MERVRGELAGRGLRKERAFVLSGRGIEKNFLADNREERGRGDGERRRGRKPYL